MPKDPIRKSDFGRLRRAPKPEGGDCGSVALDPFDGTEEDRVAGAGAEPPGPARPGGDPVAPAREPAGSGRRCRGEGVEAFDTPVGVGSA